VQRLNHYLIESNTIQAVKIRLVTVHFLDGRKTHSSLTVFVFPVIGKILAGSKISAGLKNYKNLKI
jgi:hypothetical protein